MQTFIKINHRHESPFRVIIANIFIDNSGLPIKIMGAVKTESSIWIIQIMSVFFWIKIYFHNQYCIYKNAKNQILVYFSDPVGTGRDLSLHDDLTGKAGSAYQQARAMREKYAAMQAKISYEKEIGLLLVAHDVKMAVADGDALIRNRLEALPDILAPQLAAEKDEQRIRALLSDQIEYLLDELSRSFKSMEKI
jgi:hypothetical protein